jgi:hypothetical protein
MPERFSASTAAKQMACYASANLEEAIPGYTEPEPDGVVRASDVGTEAHEVFEKLMGYTASEMRHWIRVLEYVAALRSTRRFKVLREYEVEATWLEPDPVTGKVPKTTLDLALYTQDELHVLDLKWGKILVDVIDNDQLIYYAVSVAHLAPKAKGVTIHVLQPRADNLESIYYTADEMQEWMLRARKAQAEIHSGNLAFGPSDHCKFCPAYPHSRGQKGSQMCPATLRMLYPPVVDDDAILNL